VSKENNGKVFHFIKQFIIKTLLAYFSDDPAAAAAAVFV